MSGATAGAPPPQQPFAARRALLLGYVTLLVLGAGGLGWGTLASIAGAAIVAGRVEVESREQAVEHLDGGTVGEVRVRNGDQVGAGQVLLRLDDPDLRSEAGQLRAEATELAARRNRLEAEFRDSDTIAWDAELIVRADTEPSVAEVLKGQARLFAARRDSRAGRTAQLRERIGQTRKQIASLEAQAGAAARQRALIAQELQAHRALYENKMTGIRPLLELERETARLDGQIGDIGARIAGARGRIAELQILILQIGTERVEEAEAGVRETQARENQVRERLVAVRGKLARTEIRAPVAGEVFAMSVFARGEVVRPGEPILKIVPRDADLVVRASVDPIHIDQVWPGQDAVLRFSAFPARTTPQFEGKVLRVSADAEPDPHTGLAWYEVEVAMGRAIEPETQPAGASWLTGARHTLAQWTPSWLQALWPGDHDIGAPERPPARSAVPGLEPASPGSAPAHARELDLAPGMPVEVQLRTEERSPLSYLAKPLTDYFSRSLREE